MTATARLFREVLSDKALTHSSAAEARQIVERAEQAVIQYKTEIAQRPSGEGPTPFKKTRAVRPFGFSG